MHETRYGKILRNSTVLLYPVSASLLSTQKQFVLSNEKCCLEFLPLLTNTDSIYKQFSELAQVWTLLDMNNPFAFNRNLQKWFLSQRLEKVNDDSFLFS